MGARTYAGLIGWMLWLSACGDAPTPTPGDQMHESDNDDDDEGDGDEGNGNDEDDEDADDGDGDSDEGDGDQNDADEGDGDQGDGDAGDGDQGDGDAPKPNGPVDGDPSKPVVTLPDVACGPPKGGYGPLGSANVKVGGRDVIVTYPCNKHEGAQVTVLLLLHGTQATESIKFYTHGYFAAYKLVDTHNLIVVEPKSVVSQWGNGDDGKDKPHLYAVIDWVYEKFAKYNLTGLWVAGHSWGAMFAKTFVCDEMLKDRAVGVIGMSGGTSKVGGGSFGTGGGASSGCGARVSQIHTVGDTDSVKGLPDQSADASGHGCGSKTSPKDLGDAQMLAEWPDCDQGWTHAEYTMSGHSHTTAINAPVVEDIVKRIKSTE